MKLWIGMSEKGVICISDDRDYVRSQVKQAKCEFTTVFNTEKIHLTRSAMANISEEYSALCLEDSLWACIGVKFGLKREDSEAGAIVDDMVSDVLHDIDHYGVDESFAIDEAMEKYDPKLVCLATRRVK